MVTVFDLFEWIAPELGEAGFNLKFARHNETDAILIWKPSLEEKLKLEKEAEQIKKDFEDFLK